MAGAPQIGALPPSAYPSGDPNKYNPYATKDYYDRNPGLDAERKEDKIISDDDSGRTKPRYSKEQFAKRNYQQQITDNPDNPDIYWGMTKQAPKAAAPTAAPKAPATSNWENQAKGAGWNPPTDSKTVRDVEPPTTPENQEPSRKKTLEANRRGRRSTILTGAGGLEDEPKTTRKTLLGA